MSTSPPDVMVISSASIAPPIVISEDAPVVVKKKSPSVLLTTSTAPVVTADVEDNFTLPVLASPSTTRSPPATIFIAFVALSSSPMISAFSVMAPVEVRTEDAL